MATLDISCASPVPSQVTTDESFELTLSPSVTNTTPDIREATVELIAAGTAR
ncbi:hypothetical protein [Haloarcula amylovorans]|uniref:hypothetical protein n=1 Tax=Haloarcula amylovorans TaxID=2562280 RepID=UPI0014314678|nr:hypothetical protein [Halomicroarcula amylolytica]